MAEGSATLVAGDESATLNITDNDAPLLVVGSNVDDDATSVAGTTDDHVVPKPGFLEGVINGAGGNDILIGDPGAVTLTAGDKANIVLVLDSLGSMSASISFGGSTITRMQALKNAANNLIDNLAATGASDIRIHLIDFDDDAAAGSTFDLRIGGATNTAGVTAAHDFINSPTFTDEGATNYEAGLQRAIDWINGTSANDPIAAANVNKLVFVSDGEPNRAYSGNGTSTVDTVSTIPKHSGISPEFGFYGDNVNEITRIETAGDVGADQAFTIEAVGIQVGDPSTALDVLDDVEDGVVGAGGAGDATNITTRRRI